MTIYQVVPVDLQGTLFFKIVQKIMREIPSENKEGLRKFKYGLFMLLHVESQASFAHTLNDNIRDSMEELGVGSVSLNPLDFENPVQDMVTRVEREVTLGSEEMIVEEEPLCTGFEEVFVRAAERVECEHDFLAEIRFRREQEKERMMRDIQERVARMKAK